MQTIYTVAEVAEYLKLSKSKVYLMAQRGTIPSIKIGRNVRIRKKDLETWLEQKASKELIWTQQRK